MAPDANRFSRVYMEVIQPQIPLRLPCYDLTPLTDQELDIPV